MAVRNIVQIPNKILREKTQKVKEFNSEIREIAKDLIDTVKVAEEPEGAGLAAPQIGSNKRICVVRDFFVDPANPKKILSQDIILVNPKIIHSSKDTEIDWEGCLSVPNEYGKVERNFEIKISAQDEYGKDFKLKAEGFLARTILHEMDHLEGILFTDKVIGNTISEKELDKLIESESPEDL